MASLVQTRSQEPYRVFQGGDLAIDYLHKGIEYMFNGVNLKSPAEEILLYRCNRIGLFYALFKPTSLHNMPSTNFHVSTKLVGFSFSQSHTQKTLEKILKSEKWQELPEQIRLCKKNICPVSRLSFYMYFVFIKPKMLEG